MRTDRLSYDLPSSLIAQRPLDRREASRLLVLDRSTGRVEHHGFEELPGLLPGPCLLVVNDTRVFPARLIGTRAGGGRVELLLVRRLEASESGELWQCLGRPRRKLGQGSRLKLGPLDATVEGSAGDDLLVRLAPPDDVARAVETIGHVPLPPYIRRADEPSDRERYQTIFARHTGAVAAPTAGLHFSEPLVSRLTEAGHGLTSVTLHVGPGTFKPVRSALLEDHKLEPEWVAVGEAAAQSIAAARAEGRPIVAVGTTVVRALESAAREDGTVAAWSGTTDVYLLPGHRFRAVDALITNFHLPRSTLLALVAAFGGCDHVLAAYREAVERCYRFYSYGDAMLVR